MRGRAGWSWGGFGAAAGGVASIGRSAIGGRGSVAERPNALALKASVLHRTGGSNPSTSAVCDERPGAASAAAGASASLRPASCGSAWGFGLGAGGGRRQAALRRPPASPSPDTFHGSGIPACVPIFVPTVAGPSVLCVVRESSTRSRSPHAPHASRTAVIGVAGVEGVGCIAQPHDFASWAFIGVHSACGCICRLRGVPAVRGSVEVGSARGPGGLDAGFGGVAGGKWGPGGGGASCGACVVSG